MKNVLKIVLILLLTACSQDQKIVHSNPKNNKINSTQWFNLYQCNQFIEGINAYYPVLFSSGLIDSLNIKGVKIVIVDSPFDIESKLVSNWDFDFYKGNVNSCNQSIFYDAKTRWERNLLYLKPADGMHYPVSHTKKSIIPLSNFLGAGSEILSNTDIPIIEADQLSDSLLRITVWKGKKTVQHFYMPNNHFQLNLDSLAVGTFLHIGLPTQIEQTAEKLPLNLWLTIFSIQKDSLSGQPLYIHSTNGSLDSKKTFLYRQDGQFYAWIDSVSYRGDLIRTSLFKVKYDSLIRPKSAMLSHFPMDGKKYTEKTITFDWEE